MDRKNFIKSSTRPIVYRSLNVLSPSHFPVKYKKKIDTVRENKIHTQIAKLGLSMDKLSEKIYNASLGELNEVSNLIGDGSTVTEDNSDHLYITLFIFVALMTFVMFKIYSSKNRY